MTSSGQLTLRGLGTRYGGAHWALRDIDLVVPEGRTLAVLGPSGCGKSTLLRLVAGLEAPEAGEVALGDEVLSAPGWTASPERRGMSMVFQDYALWPHMRVRDIIGYGLRYGIHRTSAAERRDRVAELVRFLHLDGLEERRPAELSGGQQQRVSIARALATRPRLLLFDEPLSNLDAQLRGEMREELAVLLRELGTTALYVTHDVREALALADEIVVLAGGEAQQIATPSEVFSRPTNGWVANLAGFSSRLSTPMLTVAGGEASAVIGGARVSGRWCGTGEGEPAVHLHPEATSLTDDPAAPEGVVVSSVFEGRRHRLRVEIDGAGSVVVAAPHDVAPGSAVRVSMDPDGVLLFGQSTGEGAAHAAQTVSRTAVGQHPDGVLG